MNPVDVYNTPKVGRGDTSWDKNKVVRNVDVERHITVDRVRKITRFPQ